jgi:hypothetical protein
MPQPMIECPILDESKIEPKDPPCNLDQRMKNPLPISYKRPQDNQTNHIVPSKIKIVYKVKEKVVEQNLMVPFVPPTYKSMS